MGLCHSYVVPTLNNSFMGHFNVCLVLSTLRRLLGSSLRTVESGLSQGGSKASRLRAKGKAEVVRRVKVDSMRGGSVQRAWAGERVQAKGSDLGAVVCSQPLRRLDRSSGRE